jgi:hypothetical protein
MFAALKGVAVTATSLIAIAGEMKILEDPIILGGAIVVTLIGCLAVLFTIFLGPAFKNIDYHG